LELVTKTYLDFDRADLLCPKKTLCIYGLDEVNTYINTKLKYYPPNPSQRHQIEERRRIFMEGHSIPDNTT
jgi:hypothetical protein